MSQEMPKSSTYHHFDGHMHAMHVTIKMHCMDVILVEGKTRKGNEVKSARYDPHMDDYQTLGGAEDPPSYRSLSNI